MPREPQKLRSQLLTWLFIPLLLLLIIDTFVSYWVAVEFSRRAYDRSLAEIAREISLHLKESAGGVALDLPPDSRQILLTDPEDRIHFEVSGPDGRFAEGEPLPHAEEPAGVARGEERYFEAVVRGASVRVVELRVEADSVTARPAAIVRVAETQLKRRALAREILLSVVIPQALIILVAGIVVWIGVMQGLSPLERLRLAVAARSHRDWSPIVADDVPAEVRPLLDSINDLVGRLDRALTLQNRFISDAAHQLKTPVTVLKAQLEVALREDDPERLRLALVTAQTGLERLSRVVSQLLSLARNEPEAAREVALAPVDLNALALDVSQGWVPEALRKRIDMGFEGSDRPVMIRGEDSRLRVMLDNLVDNAVRYTPDGGHVTVRVSAGLDTVLEVSDDGPRIPSEERQRVFERFHRLLGNTQAGSGLGLSIAREIARVHGATIELREDADGVGNAFRVTFPQPAPD
ncbi:MAG: sensor histidine kinase N-terminal domain-containing protein [Usitatibacter sp.]